ncbi:recombinase family protein [Kitasatospora sp. NPDC056651]|uniref:recombinase family protein n=1 Tax=Kitasatospora sp. NPDC056651 TaxID=3345892 RepID=UPI0036B681F6
MTVLGYTLVSSDPHDLAAQTERLRTLGADNHRIFQDRPGTRHGLTRALALTRPGDILATPALDRLAPSPEALHDLTAELIDHEITLDIGGIRLDPANHDGHTLLDAYLTALGLHGS